MTRRVVIPWETKREPRIFASVILTVCGLVAFTRGFAYLPFQNADPGFTHFIETYIPLSGWAVIWMVAGVGCWMGVVSKTVARISLSATSGLWATWCVSYIITWLLGETQRAWLTAGPFGLIAVFTIIVLASEWGEGVTREPEY